MTRLLRLLHVILSQNKCTRSFTITNQEESTSPSSFPSWVAGSSTSSCDFDPCHLVSSICSPRSFWRTCWGPAPGSRPCWPGLDLSSPEQLTVEHFPLPKWFHTAWVPVGQTFCFDTNLLWFHFPSKFPHFVQNKRLGRPSLFSHGTIIVKISSKIDCHLNGLKFRLDLQHNFIYKYISIKYILSYTQ